jgi:hypothetical protein
MADGHLIYGTELYQLADAAEARAAIEAALDSKALFADVLTARGNLRIYVGNGAPLAVLEEGDASGPGS